MLNLFNDIRQLSPAPLLAAGAAKGVLAKGAATKGAAGKGAAKGGGKGMGNLMDGMGKGGGGNAKIPELIAGGGALLQGASKTVLGMKQKRKAKQIKPVRPVYEVPKEKLETAAMYRNQLRGEDPVTKRAEASIEKQAANQVGRASKYATSGADVLGMLGVIQEGTSEATQNLAAQAAQRRSANMSAYARAMEDVASEKSKAWDYNKKQKFEEMSATKAALTEAGLRNTRSGTKEMIAAGSKIAGTLNKGESGDNASPNNAKPGMTGKKKKPVKVNKKGIQKDTSLGKSVDLPSPSGGGIMSMMK